MDAPMPPKSRKKMIPLRLDASKTAREKNARFTTVCATCRCLGGSELRAGSLERHKSAAARACRPGESGRRNEPGW